VLEDSDGEVRNIVDIPKSETAWMDVMLFYILQGKSIVVKGTS